MQQMTLTGEPVEVLNTYTAKDHKLVKDRDDLALYTPDYIKEYLRTELYVWDMRCWKKYKDRKEVEAYIKKPTMKSCGHAQYIINFAHRHNVISDKEMIQAVMDNPQKTMENEKYIGELFDWADDEGEDDE